MAEASFEIAISAQTDGVQVAAARVSELSAKILSSDKAARVATTSVEEAASAYKKLEGVYVGLLKQSEKLEVSQDSLQKKLARATAAGDEAKVKALTEALQTLADKQAQVAARTEKVKGMFEEKAAILDIVRGKSNKTSEALAVNANELAEGFGKLGGPFGRIAQQLTDQAVLYKKIQAGSGGALGLGTITAIKLGNALAYAATAGAGLVAGLVGAASAFAGTDEERAQFTAGLAKAKAGFKALFSGISLAPILSAFERIVGLLDASSASGRALKAILETLLGPIIGQFDDFGAAVERAILQAEVAFFEFLVSWKTGQAGLGADMRATVQVLKGLWEATKILFDGLAAVGAVLVAVISAVGVGFATVGTAVLAALAVVTGAITAFVGLLTGDFDLFQIGVDMVTGLAGGILSAGGKVIESLTGVVSGAVDSAKKFLGIASPSKLLAGVGMNTAEGYAQGVEQGTPEAATAVEAMATPPPALSTAGSNAGQGAGPNQGGATSGGANLSGNTFNFYGVQGAEDARARFEETLLKILDGTVAQLGGASA
jgi:phage-related protein